MKRKTNIRNVNGQYIMRPTAMLKSPAFAALSLSEHRILFRIEIEHASKGGTANGKLPVTHENFRKFGIHRNIVGPSLRAVCALGFIQITEQGVAAAGAMRTPTQFRITYQRTDAAPATDEWSRITTVEEAARIAAEARANTPKRYKNAGKFPVSLFDKYGSQKVRLEKSISGLRK